jgi:cell division protein FtsL
MICRIAFILLLIACGYVTAKQIDMALELSDHNSQIQLQKQALDALNDITNQSLGSCELKSDKLIEIAKKHGYAGSEHGFGPFSIKTQKKCVTEIKLVAF